jgi:hypothetical protein
VGQVDQVAEQLRLQRRDGAQRPRHAGWATQVFGLVLLGFGIAPSFPPALPVATALLLAVVPLVFLPGRSAYPRWRPGHSFAAVAGPIFDSMAITFVGFIGAARADLNFKIAVDALAVGLLAGLGWKAGRRASVETGR